ncbi:hypothetical protein PVAP13_1KG263800 [Panicum virgatum]|uniref:Uncharacterized protein n=1 Tax=Panicum virgatum TaxID=38727 RepID=A0A8T0X9F0_PANVG|nr:hypothetical protein PVAP13_1KG263800 [Panicum virgatum]
MTRDPLPPRRPAPTPTSSASSPLRTRSRRAKRHAGDEPRTAMATKTTRSGPRRRHATSPCPRRTPSSTSRSRRSRAAPPPPVPSSSCVRAPPTVAPTAAGRATRAPSPSTSRARASRWGTFGRPPPSPSLGATPPRPGGSTFVVDPLDETATPPSRSWAPTAALRRQARVLLP